MIANSIEKIKRITISALVSDDLLMGLLVLKGGNALNIAYELTNRGSIDIDFSMETDFDEKTKKRLQNYFAGVLKNEFSREGYYVFDVLLKNKPFTIKEEVKDFWGGYEVHFKLIENKRYNEFNGDIDLIRRNALVLGKRNSTKFKIDISKYEYIGNKKPVDIEGSTVYVYSPEMLAIEKLRAICQQNPTYESVIIRQKRKPRTRDFYDFYVLTEHFNIDYSTNENKKLIDIIFKAKRVSRNFIKEIPNFYDFHSQEWETVRNTINPEEKLEDFEFYFFYLIEKLKPCFN